VKDQVGRASLTHLNDAQPPTPPDPPKCPFQPRRSFNNVFVVVNTVPPRPKPVSWLPNPTWPAATDGNCYFRAGAFPDADLFRHFRYTFGDQVVPRGEFTSLEALRGGGSPASPPSAIFEHSRTLHPPGFEASSIAEDPLFRDVPALADAAPADDFRLRPESPCLGAGVVLPADLRVLDGAPPQVPPDIGCFRSADPPLSVGVDGLRTFPVS
jgi:hypothetical protein